MEQIHEVDLIKRADSYQSVCRCGWKSRRRLVYDYESREEAKNVVVRIGRLHAKFNNALERADHG